MSIAAKRFLAGLGAGVFAAAVVAVLSTDATATAAEDEQRTKVDVILDEFVIKMPTTLTPGPYTFQIENQGQLAHNLKIDGPGVEKELEEDLRPFQEATMDVDLQVGEYDVTCPVGDHVERGMKLTLTVEEEEEDRAR